MRIPRARGDGRELEGCSLGSRFVEAAFFDLDKTIIAKSAMLAFGKPLYAAGFLNRRMILRAMYGQAVFMIVGADAQKMDKLRNAMLTLIRGWDQQRVADIVSDALDEVVSPIVYAEALELIREHKEAGRKVVIISSSPSEVVGPMARYLEVDDFVATRAQVDADGRYTGELDFYAYGPYKAEAMREMAAAEGIDLSASYAYTDSITDLPMLEAVGHPVAVNVDKDLGRAARERGWEIREFKRPVRVRRVTAPSKGPSIALGAVIVAGAAGAIGWWWWSRRSTTATAAAAAPRTSSLATSAERAASASSSLMDSVRYGVRAIRSAQRAASLLAARRS